MKRILVITILVIAALGLPSAARGQQRPDPELLVFINKIKAIDYSVF